MTDELQFKVRKNKLFVPRYLHEPLESVTLIKRHNHQFVQNCCHRIHPESRNGVFNGHKRTIEDLNKLSLDSFWGLITHSLIQVRDEIAAMLGFRQKQMGTFARWKSWIIEIIVKYKRVVATVKLGVVALSDNEFDAVQKLKRWWLKREYRV